MITILVLLVAFVIGVFVFMQQPIFGADPADDRLARVEKSPNYKGGSFQNLHETPVQSEEFSFWKLLGSYLNPPAGRAPVDSLPSVKTDLKNISGSEPVLVWFGHSSYFIRIAGKNLLIDPVFSGNASPVSFFAKSYPGTNGYGVNDFPELDAVLISHDHYDHLDYKTIVQLKSKTKHFYTALGVGAHLERWGIEPDRITEFDWWESKPIFDSVELIATPARHFSGRSFSRGKSLWTSYVIKTPQHRIYVGGDSGYDTHFKEIGEKYGPFDLAMLECGQYNTMWPYIHMMPEQVVQAAADLNAKIFMPVHWSKFTLAIHTWTDPIERVTKAADSVKARYTTPRIGEPVELDKSYPHSTWWKEYGK